MPGRIITAGLILLLVWGCAKEKSQTASGTSTPAPSDTLAAIEASLNDVVLRLRHRDKTGIYESEFDYLQRKFTFDEYWNFPQMRSVEADTTEFIDAKSFVAYPPDSVLVTVEVLFKGPSGVESILRPPPWKVFFHQGKWIRPTISDYALQKDFDIVKRQADSAAAAEEAAGG